MEWVRAPQDGRPSARSVADDSHLRLILNGVGSGATRRAPARLKCDGRFPSPANFMRAKKIFTILISLGILLVIGIAITGWTLLLRGSGTVPEDTARALEISKVKLSENQKTLLEHKLRELRADCSPLKNVPTMAAAHKAISLSGFVMQNLADDTLNEDGLKTWLMLYDKRKEMSPEQLEQSIKEFKQAHR